MKLKVEFAGGMELLFEGKKTIDLDLTDPEEGKPPLTLQAVIDDLAYNHLKEKREMFI